MSDDGKKILTPVFRGRWPALFKAESVQGSAPKFGITAIWTPAKFTKKDKVAWKTLLAAMNKASMDKFGKPWKNLPGNFKKGIRDGMEKEDKAGFGEGTCFANLSTEYRPGVVGPDAQNDKIGPEHGNQEEIYSGAYYRATVEVYAFSNVSKGVGIGLRNIQKIADGEELSDIGEVGDDFSEVDEQWLDESGDEGDEFGDLDFG